VGPMPITLKVESGDSSWERIYSVDYSI